VLIGEQGRLDLGRSVAIVEQAASALDAAHAEGLVHRDVKPANLLVAIGAGPGGSDHVYLSDFGITKRTATRSGLTRTGSFMGTLDFVPPEQIKGQDLDGRSDQYALACVLFQCLTGRVPFDRGDEAAILFAHLSEPPPSATALRDDLPAEVDDVIARGMAKEPDDRFPSCSALAAAARATIGSAPRATAPPIPAAPTVVAGPPEGDPPDATRVATPPTEPSAAASVGVTRVQPPAETGRPPAPPAPVGAPRPDGGRRRRRALIAGLVAAAAVLTILVLLLLPSGEPEVDVDGTTPDVVTTTEAPTTTTATSTSAPPPPQVSPLVGSWVGTDLGDGSTEVLVIREDGSFRVRDDEAAVCSPPGPIVIDDTGEFQGNRLFVGVTLADCTQGSGDLTISEFIIEYDRATDTVRSVNDPTGTVLQRVSPLVGRWEATDPDGSHLELVINVSGSFRLFDDVASGPCTPPGPATIVGTGEFRKVQGRDRFVMRDVPLDCIEGEGDITVAIIVLEHDPVADMLFDPKNAEAAVFHRA
jgi:hypothetical protein